MAADSLPPFRGRRVREFVCSYRTLRDDQGQAARLSTLALSDPRVAADTLAPLPAQEAVEIFAVACLACCHREASASHGSDPAPSIPPWMVGRSSGSSSLSLRSTPLGACGLDGPSGPPRLGNGVMAGSL